MKRTNPPKSEKKTDRKKPGPKSQCTPKVIKQAKQLAFLGLTNRELAVAFDVHVNTVEYWYRNKPAFKHAIDHGRTFFDGQVVDSLRQKAMGYSHPATKFFKNKVTEKEYDKEGNVISERTYTDIIKVPYVKKYPPDTKAAIKLLAARRREQWGDAHRVEHKHAHMHVGDTNILQIVDQLGQAGQFSDDELELIEKLGLKQVEAQITNGSRNGHD